MIEKSQSYINWKQSSLETSCVDCTWNVDNLDFDWQETIQTQEVDPNDVWETHSTRLKYELAELHNSWGIHGECVKHYMCFKPKLTDGLERALDPFLNSTYSYNLIKVTSGRQIVWHFDTYATFVKRHGISEDQADKIKRSIVMLTPWDFGHVIQIGKHVLSNWQAGEIYTWKGDTWHGVSNFGKKDWIAMQVTYIQ